MDQPTAVEEPKVDAPQPAPTPAPAPEPQDPYIDEAALSSLTPEQRASLDPIMQTLRARAKEEVERNRKSVEETYKPVREKADALDKLTKYQPFQNWWQEQQRGATRGATPQQAQAIQSTKPSDVATSEEWAQAVVDASNGNPAKLQELNARMMSMWASPFVQEITQKQKVLETTLEMKDLFERHPDAKDLDRIGLEGKSGNGTSLLEAAIYLAVDRQGGSLEQGYALAKQWSDAMKTGAKQEAMGIVQSKKETVSAGPSKTSSNDNIVYVDNADELIRKSLTASMEGQKVRFMIRPK